MKTISIVAGARPNFMKIAPIIRAFRQHGLAFSLVDTGQHYDRHMKAVFFEELDIPPPDVALAVGSGSHAEQTGRIMTGYERICREHRPDCVLVVGDVNSTLACAITAKKMGIPVAHVEAGLRSGDHGMPEEINRLVTDAISDWFFVTEDAGVRNLLIEGKSAERIHFVGHVMVDNVFFQLKKLEHADRTALTSDKLKSRLAADGPCYGVVTLHRPSNVDDPATFRRLAEALNGLSVHIPLVFPAHPRTRARMAQFGIELGSGIHITDPMGYMDFLNLWRDAMLVLTDSGGLQEETTALGVPCLTLRENTERPITVESGSNTLVGTDPLRIRQEAINVFCGNGKRGIRPVLWDGQAAQRIAGILDRALHGAGGVSITLQA